MASDPEIIIRLIIASILGGMIALEREIHGREAGVRTYLLVSLGSALIMILSENIPLKYGTEFTRGDPARIAAQAITGIGFLGAGVILRYKNMIRGLTTAACMWVSCAIGLAIGSGYYLFGLITTGITVAALIWLKILEKKLSKDWYKQIVIVSEDIAGQMDRIQQILDRYGATVTNLSLRRNLIEKETKADYRIRLRTVQTDRNLLKEVFEIEGVKCVEVN